MADHHDSSSGPFGMAAVAAGLCCVLPLVLGAGLAAIAVGPVLGIGAITLTGILLARSAWRRRGENSRPADDDREAL